MKIAVIDLDSIAYTIGNGVKLLDENGEPLKKDNKFVYRDKTDEELAQAADFYMRSILSSGGFTHYIAFIKGKGTTLRRLAVNPDYKGQRGKVAPHWWEYVKTYLITHWGAIEANGAEVDDYVNVTRLNLKEAYIVAIDGDLLGLEGTHYNWRKNEWVTVTEQQARRKFWGDMIIGQPVDNLKGIPMRGPAYVKELFETFGDTLHTPYRIMTFGAFIKELGEYKGIEEFYKNYICLKLLEEIPGFVVPQPIEYKPINLMEL